MNVKPRTLYVAEHSFGIVATRAAAAHETSNILTKYKAKLRSSPVVLLVRVRQRLLKKFVSTEPSAVMLIAPSAEAVDLAKSATAPSFSWPVQGRVIANFGANIDGQQNEGINLAVPEGTDVHAAEDGVVAYAGSKLKGYGNLIPIRHANGFVTGYAHASEIMVKPNDAVRRGQVIAKSGQTGTVTSPQLHFEIHKGSVPVDPIQHLPDSRGK